jgi:hypothetical protein
MARFIKHVGLHGDRKVAVVFRQVPNEEHMCLVVYTQLLNQNIHDPLMATIESDIGQVSKELADALNRTHTRDGKIILQVLHSEGMLKKVNTEQIVMTPAPRQHIRLNELNKLLNEMEQGEAAVRRLAEIDASKGLQDPADIAKRMRGEQPAADRMFGAKDALGDNELANNLRQQAAKMSAEAKGLLAEADRLIKEAASMEGVMIEEPAPKAKATKKTATKAPAKKSTRSKVSQLVS